MNTKFRKLNHNWNAEPNAPYEKIHLVEDKVILSFDTNEESRSWLVFAQCWRYRLGATNDEGWIMGKCRFSKVAPEWGNFYGIQGDINDSVITDWIKGPSRNIENSKHYLFYLRDSTFECDAAGWSLINFPSPVVEYREIPNWEKKRNELIERKGGLSDKICIWKNCHNYSIKNMNVCVDHAYPELSGKIGT